ncbi:MAG: acyl-CoA dehydrogenase [Acidimicrobiales bacterium]|nr:MAG: acyl-CoA dehydrogenase [Acidimicrobiales bacterium]
MPDWKDALERVINDVVAPDAERVDAEGSFPLAGIEALGDAGLLGLTSSAAHGGGGGDLAAAAHVVERLAASCGSTAMIVMMHYTATAAIMAHGRREVRRAIASGGHLSTLAFSEAGSRSHFWASQSSATPSGDGAEVRLDAKKSWVTAANHAQSYVWSSLPLAAEGPMTLWLVPADTPGLHRSGGFDGMGLRGNDSVPVTAEGAKVAATAMLGADGGGLDLALMVVLPWFLVLSGAFSSGIMEAVTAEAARHLGATRLEHLDQTLIQQPMARADLARMRLATDTARTLVGDTIAAVASSREDAMLRVLEVKAVAAEAALQVTDLAMKVCGGSAFRKELGIERRFRDSRAARVMAPTTDALLDFVGRVVGGLPLLGP